MLPFLVVWPKMLRIMAGMTRGVPKIGFSLEMTSHIPVFSSLVRQWMHISVRLQRSGPELQKTADSTPLQFIAGHRLFSCRRGSSSRSRLFSRSSRLPSCCSMVDIPVMRVCSFSCAAVETFLALPHLQLVEKSSPLFFLLSAVAVHRWSSTFPFVPQSRSSWSSLSRPQSFLSCCTFQVADAPVVLVVCWLRCASSVFLLVVAGQVLLGRYGPEGQLQWRVEGWYCWLQYTSRCFLFPFSQAHDARHHGLYGPKGQWQCLFLYWFCW